MSTQTIDNLLLEITCEAKKGQLAVKHLRGLLDKAKRVVPADAEEATAIRKVDSLIQIHERAAEYKPAFIGNSACPIFSKQLAFDNYINALMAKYGTIANT